MSGLNAWHAWQESGRSGKWAHNHFLNHRTLLRAADIRAQLTHHLRCPFVLSQQSAGVCSAVPSSSSQRMGCQSGTCNSSGMRAFF